MFKRWDELTHRSRKWYEFRQHYIMGPFKKIAALTPWYDQNAYAEFLQRRDETFREWLPGSSVLELGCGPGYLSAIFSATYGTKTYVGVDYSLGMVRDARSQYFFDFVNADAFYLPFPDKSFDVVFSAYLFHHLPPKKRSLALQEQARVARRALIIEETFGFEPGFWRWPYWAYYTLADGSFYRYTLKEWPEIFRSINIRLKKLFFTQERTILHRLICMVAEPIEGGRDPVG
ncbi:MAG: class I SAM-dependent methyltransferase [Deltaproteobacteria bacterium]|nr:MAG: class I SAM-dependent methyltransferase [Deltaproteobacteria bacterium]